MSREQALWLHDMEVACGRILEYTKGLGRDDFERDPKTRDAVMRNIEIVGEAAKNVSDEFRGAHPEIEWRGLAGLRDVVIHAYFGVDDDIIWDVVAHKVPALADELRRFRLS